MSPGLAALGPDDFAALLGATFRLQPAGQHDALGFEVQLTSVNSGAPGLARTQFSVIFTGGPTPPIPQGIHRLTSPELGDIDLFLVPLGPGPGGQRYEAVFA